MHTKFVSIAVVSTKQQDSNRQSVIADVLLTEVPCQFEPHRVVRGALVLWRGATIPTWMSPEFFDSLFDAKYSELQNIA